LKFLPDASSSSSSVETLQKQRPRRKEEETQETEHISGEQKGREGEEAEEQKQAGSESSSGSKKRSRAKIKVETGTVQAVAEAKEEKVRIGPPQLTRFERARIIGARSLQLALGAPPFIPVPSEIRDPIVLAIAELDSKALPISIRRTLPDGSFQDIPIEDLL
jgi:DNA-directed RNA polymerase I, II, and III subunit RPABC2